MPRAREELLDAVLSYPEGTEDRLTEILATVLDAHEDFTRALFKRAEIALPDVLDFQVHTQVPVDEGMRPDMRVMAFDEGGLVAQLWSEHKTGSGFRGLQLEDYTEALAVQQGPSRLLGIVPAVESECESPDWMLLTWQEVAELANREGRAWAARSNLTRDWRLEALAPDAPARERLLHELIWYLEEENFAVVDALESENVSVFARTPETLVRLSALLARAGDFVEAMAPSLQVDGDVDGYGDRSVMWQLFKVPSDSWLRRLHQLGWLQAYPELMVSCDDRWWSKSVGEPAFGAGYTITQRLYGPLGADRAWIRLLQGDGLDFDVYDECVRVYRTKPVVEIVGDGSTLDEQARSLAAWARRSIELAGEHDPDAAKLPAKGRAGKKGAPEARFTQPITESDIQAGVIRIPQGETKGLFPGNAGEVEIELRGSRASCDWNPRPKRGQVRERSGGLRVGSEHLDGTVEPGERLSVSVHEDVIVLK